MTFLVTYFIGLSLTVVYLVIIEAWAGAGFSSFNSVIKGPAILELVMCVALIISKFIIDRRYPPKNKRNGLWIQPNKMRFDLKSTDEMRIELEKECEEKRIEKEKTRSNIKVEKSAPKLIISKILETVEPEN